MAESVFYDIAATPQEATNLTARSLLMIAIEQKIQKNGWTQAKAARILGVQQPRVSDLMNGKIDKFSVDALINMLPAVGLTFSVGPAQPKPRPAARLVGGEIAPPRPRKRTLPATNGRRPAVPARSKKVTASVANASPKGTSRSGKR